MVVVVLIIFRMAAVPMVGVVMVVEDGRNDYTVIEELWEHNGGHGDAGSSAGDKEGGQRSFFQTLWLWILD